ncbi:hypothetical protein NDU88_003005 [Pleurodeles waltl]|uniref:Lipoprotein n=1 Tax=Pleurodeles waltl TaxID=8319 RepID=A0AAV7TMB5_PLEWA|nr:hypothetical protein NDU88_003005 [Pleurodeles waltl]
MLVACQSDRYPYSAVPSWQRVSRTLAACQSDRYPYSAVRRDFKGAQHFWIRARFSDARSLLISDRSHSLAVRFVF